MNATKIVISSRKNLIKTVALLAIGAASVGLTGCLDAGITSNLCVLEGICNGGVDMP